MRIGRLAWGVATGIALAACGAGEAPVSAGIQSGIVPAIAQAADTQSDRSAAEAEVPASSLVLTLGDLSPEGPAAAAAAEAALVTDPVLPPELVRAMREPSLDLTIDPHGDLAIAFDPAPSDAMDLILGSTSVVDDLAPPADIEVE